MQGSPLGKICDGQQYNLEDLPAGDTSLTTGAPVSSQDRRTGLGIQQERQARFSAGRHPDLACTSGTEGVLPLWIRAWPPCSTSRAGTGVGSQLAVVATPPRSLAAPALCVIEDQYGKRPSRTRFDVTSARFSPEGTDSVRHRLEKLSH